MFVVRRIVAAGRAWLPAGVSIAGAAVLLGFSERWYPISQWLLWHYLGIIGLTLYVGIACLSLGDLVLSGLFRLALPTHERIAVGFFLGLTGFELCMFLLGAVQGYGSAAFVLLPLALSVLGVPRWRAGIRRCSRLARVGPRLTPSQAAFVLFGLGALALIYFSILTPYNVQFDARWKHMALAEDYVAHGGLRRMPEGWVFATRPHLTSYLYVWAFLLPFGTLFHRMVLAAHLEYLVFLVTTLCAIPALVRRLVPKADARVVWVARFLFPGVLLYDSSLSAGADHFGALIAPVLGIVLIRVYRQLEPKWVLLGAICLAAAAMVKETVAIMLVPIPLVVVLVRAVQTFFSRSARLRRRLLTTLTLAVGLGVAITAPCWLTNWIWHGNPVYPNLGSIFPSRPWSPPAAYRFANEYSEVQMWTPSHDLRGLAASLRALLDYSFVPNDWNRYHGDRPVFGSLLTILLPLMLWLRNARRVWGLLAWIHGAIFIWYWVHHQDRYLQAILPLMAASTASILILAFRQLRAVVRWAVAFTVVLQIACTADVYFIATHAMVNSAVRKVVENLGFGHAGKFAERFVIEPKWTALGSVLPNDARVLFHDLQSHLGTGHEAVRDAALWQYGLVYSQAKHPAEIHRWLSEMGVTHIVLNANKSSGNDRLAGELLFYDFVYRRARFSKEIEGLLLFENPDQLPQLPFRNHVVVVRCDPTIEMALHPLASLAQPAVGPLSLPRAKPVATTADDGEVQRWLADADFAVVEVPCEPPPSVDRELRRVAERPKRGVLPALSLYVRRDN
jgi:hypothetical protein